ncbi:MAG: polysaccharide biosynthesis C-terminal domain-containing protein [Candidatus Nanoarchaeia archaeon]|nr:polysaccharide biosynthesis C-terminal domain-containing protein [Candidatus Nanoarchaeia archaeon]
MMERIINQIKQGRNFISFVGLKTFAEGMSFLIPLFVAGILSPDLFGSFSLFKMILFFGISIFIGPIVVPLNIESNKEYSKTKKSNKTFTSALVYLLLSISIFLLIFLFFGKELIGFTGLNFEEYKIVFILAFFGLSIKSFLATFFMSQDNKKAHIFVELFYNSLLISLIIILNLFKLLNLHNIFFSFFISAIFVLIISLVFIDFKRIFPLNFSIKNFKIITHFSVWIILGYASSYFINWGDNLVLRYFVSLEEIGVYNFAYQIFKGFIMVSLMINTYYTPFIAKNLKNKENLKKYYFNKRPKILWFSMFFIILLNILISVLINIFYPNYSNSIIIIIILSIAAFLSFYYSFLIPLFNSFKQYKIIQILLIFQILINLILNLILIPVFGIIGAAIATTLSYTLFTISINFIFKSRILNKLT